MNWAEPRWLWALVLLPVLWLALERAAVKRRKRLEAFADPALWDRIAPELDWRAPVRKGRMLLLSLLFAILALARPQWGSHEETMKVTGMDILIVLDVSNSMEAEDIVPSRLKKAKHLIRSMLERLEGDRVGIVAFAGSAFTASPLTTDLDYIKETVDTLSTRSVLNQGTDIAAALDTAYRALDRGAEESSESRGQAAQASVSKLVLLISDGEDQEHGAEEMARKIRGAGIRLYSFGVGSPQGAQIPVRDEQGLLHGYKRDRRGEGVVSRLDPRALETLAREGGGRFWMVTPAETELEELLKELGAFNRKEFAERRYVVREDRFQFPLAVAVLILFIELGLPARRRLTAARAGALLLALATSLPGQARAATPPKVGAPAPDVKAYLDNERGREAFEAGRVDEAKRRFGAAQARAPESPELRFNQGSVQLKEGDVDGALQGFQGAAQGADRRGDASLAGRSWFNLGISQAQKGDTASAIGSYVQAIDRAKRSRDSEVERDARRNLELLIRQQEQKKKEQKPEQGDKKEGQQNPAGDDSKKQPDSGQQQDPNKEKQEKRYQDPSTGRRKFQSQKLSPEDANRVMDELSGRERELQARLRKQKGNPAATEKDW